MRTSKTTYWQVEHMIHASPVRPKLGASLQRQSSIRTGFTLVELVVGIAVLVIGVLGFSRAIVSSTISSQKTREVDRATQAARQILERIEATAFADRFRSFNNDPSDDPGGVGTAPGANFAVTGLSPLPGDADGLPGEVIFPTQAGFPARLREDVVMPELGMPRDLNGDGVVDANNHATDYTILPVIVRVRWRGVGGLGAFELKTMLANY